MVDNKSDNRKVIHLLFLIYINTNDQFLYALCVICTCNQLKIHLALVLLMCKVSLLLTFI